MFLIAMTEDFLYELIDLVIKLLSCLYGVIFYHQTISFSYEVNIIHTNLIIFAFKITVHLRNTVLNMRHV